MENFFNNKTVAIVGLSERTGLSVAVKLLELKANVIISDLKTKGELKPQLSILKKYDNIEYDLGGHTEKILQSDIIILSPGVPTDLEILKKAEQKGIEVISEIELAYRMTDANIIGITGTNGKTTVTSLIGHILKQNLETNVRIGGNIGSPLISKITGLKERDWLVVEVSSFQLEKIKNFRPKISVFINFSPDHLDRHKSVTKYWQAKKRIFENQEKKDITIINEDDQFLKDNLADLKPKVYKISKKEDIEQGIYFNNNMIYHIKNGKKEKIMSTEIIPLIGTHNILNTAMAVMSAKIFDINNEDIRAAVKSYEAFSHRLEVIYDKEYMIVDDSKATNPHAAINAMKSLRPSIILIAGGQDRKANFKDFAYTIKQRIKKVVLMGETSHKIKNELKNIDYNDYILVDDMQEAVSRAIQNIQKGDILLLSPGCPSWDMYENYKKRGLDFQTEIKKYLK